MANLEYVLYSFEKFFKNKTGVDAFLYTNSAIDISKVVEVSPKTALTGIETSFIIVDRDFGGDYINQDLINKYITYGTASKRITNYNPTTGQITLESAFGVAIADTEVMIVEVLDSLFINLINIGNSTSRVTRHENNVRIKIDIKTKNDSKKTKILTLIEKLQGMLMSSYFHIPMYNLSDVLLGNISIDKNINSSEGINADNNMQKYSLSFLCNYITNELK